MKKLFWIKICLLTAVLLSCTANLRYEVQAAGTEMNIYAMYLGHADRGDSVLVESKGEYLLMDIGTGNHAPAIIEQLKLLDATRVDIYFSHLHGDHVGTLPQDKLAGLKAIEKAGIEIETMYLPAPELAPLSVSNAAKYRRLENFMASRGKVVYLNVGDTFKVGDVKGTVIGPVSTELLDPNLYDYVDADTEKGSYYENNCSLVSILTCGNIKYFTAGDMYAEEARFLLQKYGKSVLDCDIMKLSHHGTGTGNIEELMDAVTPSYSFASNTGWTTENRITGRWEFADGLGCASKYGVCYMAGSEEQTMIYHVSGNTVKMYQGKTLQTAKSFQGWQTFVGADGRNRKTDTYYFDGSGRPLKGVQYLSGHYYYFGTGGRMEYGDYSESGGYKYWKDYGGEWRHFMLSEDKTRSYMTVGFREFAGELYYFGKDGLRLHGKGKTERVKLGSKYYAVTADGIIVRNDRAKIGSAQYYAGKNGVLQKNCKVKVRGKYYIFDSKGKMVKSSGSKKIVKFKGKKYCVGTSGALVVNGIGTVGKDKYYFGKDGAMRVGIKVQIGKSYYYFGNNGKMVRAPKGSKLISVKGKKYCVSTSGALAVNKCVKIGKYKYYFGKTGAMRTNARIKIKGNYYYFGKNGAMYVKKYVVLDGKRYYCRADGTMVRK